MIRVSHRMKYWLFIIMILFFFANTGQAYAALNCQLLQTSLNDDTIISYVECESNINAVNGQIAQSPCENIELSIPEDISIHTVIMLDNSLSITENNRENIKNIVKQYVQAMPEREVISLATFGEEIQFLTEKSNDMSDILQMIDNIEFHNQDTYLTDYLFQALEKVENDPEYTRFIVISDGVDNKAIGITKEELISKLKETSRPVYTIGHIYGDNSSELKNMFALSRLTCGKELLIEDFEDIGLIEDVIHDFSNIYAIKMEIPQDVMDGAKKNILLSISTEDGTVEVTGEVKMPFSLADKEAEAAPVPTPVPTPTPAPTPVPTPKPTAEPNIIEPEPIKKSDGIGIEKILCVAVLIIAVVFLIFYQKKKKNITSTKKNEIAVPKKPVIEPVILEESENNTTILDGRYLLVLRDRENPERIFRYPMDQHVIVGRNIDKVQIPIDYNLTISGQHCEFYIRNNRSYLRDMNSANHTYLDGRMINGETEVVTGNIVRLGEVEFSIEVLSI